MSDTLVTVSDQAARRITQIAADEPANKLFRVSVEGGGCSGFQYKFDMVPCPDQSDLVIEQNGATVVIDRMSLIYLAGAKLDFVDDLMGASFRIDNPNAQSSCGCGTSFSL